MEFDDWFYSTLPNGFILRAEYFYSDLDMTDPTKTAMKMKQWLEAAFDAGVESARLESTKENV